MNLTKQKMSMHEGRGPKVAMSRRTAFLAALAGGLGALARTGRAHADPQVSKASEMAAGGEAAPSNAPKQQLRDLKAVGPQAQVRTIRHRGDTFEIATADGRSTTIRQIDLHIKVDTSDYGPRVGRPVVLPGGMMGDRAMLFFASAAEISKLIR